MSEHEKDLIRAALMLHVVLVFGASPAKAHAKLQRAAKRLLKAHPKRKYRARRRKP